MALNDPLLLLVGPVWLATDWLLRIAIVSLFFLPYASRKILRPLFGFPELVPLVAWTSVCIAWGMIAMGIGVVAIGGEGLFRFPRVSISWVLADVVIGLPLVSLSEELIFRAASFLLFARFGPIWWMLVSSIAFGLVHWGHGIANVATAAMIGIGFALSLAVTRSLWPALLAHTVLNFLLFSRPQL